MALKNMIYAKDIQLLQKKRGDENEDEDAIDSCRLSARRMKAIADSMDVYLRQKVLAERAERDREYELQMKALNSLNSGVDMKKPIVKEELEEATPKKQKVKKEVEVNDTKAQILRR